ncbi:hypothetical protein ACFRAE_03455 [Sphingobacterium sp. HJSM2_6]
MEIHRKFTNKIQTMSDEDPKEKRLKAEKDSMMRTMECGRSACGEK